VFLELGGTTKSPDSFSVLWGKIFFKLIERVYQFPTDKAKDILMKVLQRNAYFSHSENVILGMLADDDEDIHRTAVDKIL